MREIKFRAWDGTEMYEPVLADGHIFRGLRDLEDYNYVDDDNLMQYTGLKDKIGKEIYEGDILRKGEFIGKVEFHNSWGAFCISNLRSIQSILFYNDSKSYEVIGNIYENPELLEG